MNINHLSLVGSIMYTLLIYDIVEDKVRNQIAELCKDYSLRRIQYSAFFGEINHNRREELIMRIRRGLGNTEGNVQLYQICSKDIKLKKEINTYGADSANRN